MCRHFFNRTVIKIPKNKLWCIRWIGSSFCERLKIISSALLKFAFGWKHTTVREIWGKARRETHSSLMSGEHRCSLTTAARHHSSLMRETAAATASLPGDAGVSVGPEHQEAWRLPRWTRCYSWLVTVWHPFPRASLSSASVASFHLAPRPSRSLGSLPSPLPSLSSCLRPIFSLFKVTQVPTSPAQLSPHHWCSLAKKGKNTPQL